MCLLSTFFRWRKSKWENPATTALFSNGLGKHQVILDLAAILHTRRSIFAKTWKFRLALAYRIGCRPIYNVLFKSGFCIGTSKIKIQVFRSLMNENRRRNHQLRSPYNVYSYVRELNLCRPQYYIYAGLKHLTDLNVIPFASVTSLKWNHSHIISKLYQFN
jgi:hypothetical protein